MERRHAFIAEIISFLAHTAERGYVGIDLYDGSLIYDFATDNLSFCDIDLFARTPYINTMGRMWGSSRFMSPEEMHTGSKIDELTNVYTAGAMAFFAFGDERDRSRSRWTGSDAQFAIATRAVSDNRSDRFPSLSSMLDAWNAS